MRSDEAGAKKARITVIDDDPAARHSAAQMLELRGYAVQSFSSAEQALQQPDVAEADCIVTDVKMPGMDGERLLARCLERGFAAPLIMITGHGDVSMAVRCLKAGAYDFVEKPFDDEILVASVARAVEKAELRRESRSLRRQLSMLSPAMDGRFGLIGRSRPMQELYERIAVAAQSEAPVLIVGETGVGKELVARAIHAESRRSEGPFVPVNAGGLPETMLESELFGHAKGAFTGALQQREGRLVHASGGSLLLDEIESISEPAQIKLLRVLEDGLVQPLGRDTFIKVDVRILATSKADLSEEVRRGTIREDFYHRIVVLPLRVPPLRERPDDIPLLTLHFFKTAAERNRMPVPEVSRRNLDEMTRYGWPGNVRELRNAVERMVITSHDGEAGPFAPDAAAASPPLLSLPPGPGRLRRALEETERAAVAAALEENAGEINATHRTLGISRRALYERMKRYGLRKEDFRPT